MGSGSISYAFSPGDLVYVIDNTPCQQGCAPYSSYSSSGCNSSVQVYPGTPMGLFAVRKGTIIELDTTQVVTNSTPVLTYSVRFGSASPGTKKFPETSLYAASPVTAGSQVVNFGGTLTGSTAISLASHSYTATITVNSVVYAITLDLSTIATFTALLTAINTQLANNAVATLVGGNIQVTSIATGNTSSVSIVDNGSFHLFASLPGYVAILSATQGANGGLATALNAYALLVA